MHTISLPHVFESDLNIRDGLGENLKSPKSPPGPRGVPVHGEGCARPWSHAWEAQGLRQPFHSLSPRIHPLQSLCGERASLSAHSSSRQIFPCPQRWLRDTGQRGDGAKLIPTSQCLNSPRLCLGRGVEGRNRLFFSSTPRSQSESGVREQGCWSSSTRSPSKAKEGEKI